MTGLELERVRFSRGGRLLVDDVDVSAPPGAITAIVGPNGAGKTTLLRLIAGVLGPDGGAVRFAGAELTALSPRARARRIALLEQEWTSAEGMSVVDVVTLGRLPHRRLLGGDTGAEARIVAESLHRAGASAFAHRDISTLSGGERQRVNLARLSRSSRHCCCATSPPITSTCARSSTSWTCCDRSPTPGSR
ncbi:ABC transporter ATP-binding protein [Microbacterium sp.]|uniref:ABC transporter ATP-binding protein n=1 Tax=Microbacterium sp. TaxID=51671 RepID=UPI0039E67719